MIKEDVTAKALSLKPSAASAVLTISGGIPYSLNINLGLHWFNTFCALRPAEKNPSTCGDFYFSNSQLFRVNHLGLYPISANNTNTCNLYCFFWYRKCSLSHNIPRLTANYHTILLWFWGAWFIEFLGWDINFTWRAFSYLIFKTLTRLIIGAYTLFPNIKDLSKI